MRYKDCKFGENRARDTSLQGRVFSEVWSNFSKIFSSYRYNVLRGTKNLKIAP